MNVAKLAARLLLTGGFLGAAFFSVRNAGRVDWRWYGACAAVALVGLVLTHLNARKAAKDSDKVASDLEAMTAGLSRLVATLDTLWSDREALDVYGVHARIDETLRDDLAEVAVAREALIPLYGLELYAQVMTQFAGGERYINRAWSASADGYIDEVWRSVDIAREQIRRADVLVSNRRGASGEASEAATPASEVP